MPDESDTKDKLGRLRAKRRGHRGVITKIEKEALERITTDTDNHEATTRLDALNEQLKTKQKTLEELGEKILELCNLEDIDGEIHESDEVQSRITGLKTMIKSRNSAAQRPTHVPMDEASNVTSSATAVPVSMTKLPRLELPRFKGDVTHWRSFWDSFDSAVHSNQAISKIDKYNHLKSLLEGSASRAIQGLTLTEANYDAAIDLLNSRFGKPQQVISAHMDE